MNKIVTKLNKYSNKIEDQLSDILKCYKKRIDIFAIIILALITLVIFRSILITRQPFIFGGDYYFLDLPFRLLAWESITKGQWPLWNPYNSGGMNLLGQPFFFLIYPLYDLIYLFTRESIFEVLSLVQIFHIFLALVGMYFLLKKIIKDPFISFWGSILYGFSYPLVDAFYIGQLLASYAYIPWIMLVLYSLDKRSYFKNILLLSLLIFLLVGGGFPQWSIFTLFIIFLFIAFKNNPFKQKTRRKFLTELGIFFISGIIAFLLGSIEFIPFIEQNIHGARVNIDFNAINTQQEWITPWFLSFRLFIPQLFNENLKNFVHNTMIFLEDNFNSYFGIAAALLSITGLFTLRRKLFNSWKIVFITIFLIALGIPIITTIISFIFLKADLVYTRIGGFLPLVGVVLASEILRESLVKQKKMVLVINILLIFSLLLISTLLIFTFWGKGLLGADLNVTYIQKQIIIGIIFVFSYLLIFLLFRKKILGRKILLILLCILAIIEINCLSLNKIKQHLSVRPAQEYFEKTESEKILDNLLDKDKYRIHNTSVRFEEITHLGGHFIHYFPNANIFNKFYEANGYILNMPKDIGQLLTNMKGGYFIRMADVLIYSSLPNLLSIKYIITPQNFDPYNNRLDLSREYKVINEFTDGTIYNKYNLKIIEIENVTPRFFFTKKVEGNKDRELIFDLIINNLFDPRNITYFEDNIGTKIFDTSKQKVEKIEVPSANQVIVKVKTESPGILVANNFYHKWWKVKINGVSQKLYRVNYDFQGVEIPIGTSIVYFYCESESLKLGMYLSILGLIIVIIISILAFKRNFL